MSKAQRRDHAPDPDHKPQPVFCLVCDEELKSVYDARKRRRYWRHLRRPRVAQPVSNTKG